MKVRTKLLFAIMIALGAGIGILSGLNDGLYSAACLFALPIVVTLTGACILADLGREEPRKAVSQIESREQDVDWRQAA